MTHPWLSAVAPYVEGLLVPSESDAPLVPIAFGPGVAPGEHAVARFVSRPVDAVERTTVEDAFADAARIEAWHDPRERDDARRFQALVTFVRESLDGVCAFRVGETDVTLVVLGKATDGAWVGLRAELVET